MEVLVLFVSSDMVEDDVVEGNFENFVGVLLANGVGILLGFLGILRAAKNN